MSIKADRWIRQMAEQYGMIEPFEPGQVRHVNGEKIVSYGTSSYGYDVRCANEFKIFTNINSAIVDPKNFDENSFVDFTGDVCIIPPNSFALARTVEYFRIPRSVLTVCLGKSTYARCFRGDTRVALVDGSAPTLEEMAVRAEQGELFWGYSIGENGRLIVTQLEAPRYIGRDSLVEVTLDNGKSIFATPEHLFMLRDGQWCEAGNLRAGASLMPLYRQLARGYEMVYQPLNGHLYPTHRLADEWNLRQGIYNDLPNTHRHHVDFDRLNNNPWNIVRMDAKEHITMHNAESYGEEFDPDEHSASIKAALAERMQNPEWAERYASLQQERAMRFWHDDEYQTKRAELLAQRRNPTDATREAHRQAMLQRYQDLAERARQGERMRSVWANAAPERYQKQAEIARNLRLRGDISEGIVLEALNQTGSIRGAARLLDCDRSVFRRFPQAIDQFRGLQGEARRNHKVVSVRDVAGDHDVYCLTVPEAGNFALEDGVFVHNCGIIVNVTPLEPEWEGHVTLEFSNTTTLPAKIYANEGVAQMLFFESDQMCETSYKDRGGKYQGQRGVTLPRT
ncbi:MAG: dCTP deaminase [Thiofilum sp.]|nr:dCTP deaminase [Thiofilum sp.]